MAFRPMESAGISVVLVLKDRANTIPTTLAHLEQQTLPASRLEIVAVDNGSSDGTLAVLERYAAGAPVRIHILDAGRQSFAQARNLGLERARGRWVVFIDQDMLASPNLLLRYARAFDSTPSQSWLLGPVAMHPQLPPDVLTRHLLQEQLPEPADPLQLRPFEWHGYNFGAARALLRDQGGFDESFAGPHFLEAAMAHRLAERGVFGRVAEKAFVYEWRPAVFDDERARQYARGYELHRLESAIGPEAAARLLPESRGLQWRMHDFLMPFYVRACRNAEGDLRYAAGLFRRVLLHDFGRGYADARKGRVPRTERGSVRGELPVGL